MKKTLKILASFIFAGILLAELPEPKISGIDFYLINVEPEVNLLIVFLSCIRLQ